MQKKVILMFILLIIFVIGSYLLFFNFNNEKEILKIPDFSKMTYDESNLWCKKNNIECSIKKEYSDIKYGKLISQSVKCGTKFNRKSKIVIIYSNGNEATDSQKEIMNIAKKYSDKLFLSKIALYNQLITLKYSEEDSEYAVNHIDVDYKENALKRAKEYQKIGVDELIIHDSLLSSLEGFTEEEVNYALNNLKKSN